MYKNPYFDSAVDMLVAMLSGSKSELPDNGESVEMSVIGKYFSLGFIFGEGILDAIVVNSVKDFSQIRACL